MLDCKNSLILDNIIFSLQKVGGISLVWYHLLKEITDRGIKAQFIEYTNENIYRRILNIKDENIIKKDKKFLPLKRYFSPVVRLQETTIFHSSYYRTLSNPNVKNISTVHDFTYEYYNSGLRKSLHSYQKFKAINNSDIIVCISENTRKDLKKFLPHISDSKIEIIYNGVSDEYYPIENNIKRFSDYLIYVGSRAKYKNFDFAVQAAAKLNKRIIICGDELNDFEKKQLINDLGLGKFEIKIRPTNEELNQMYNSAYALIYPSSYEGFGLPVIEAQKAGCPIIALEKSSIPEIIGKDYPLLKGLNLSELSKISLIIDNERSREELKEMGIKNSARFSWDKMTSQYIELYDSMKKC